MLHLPDAVSLLVQDLTFPEHRDIAEWDRSNLGSMNGNGHLLAGAR